MPVCLFVFTPPPLSICLLRMRLLVDGNQSQLVALLTRASHSAVQCSWALRLQGECRMVQSRLRMKLIYPGRKKKNTPRLTNGIMSHFLTCWKSLLILPQFSTQVFFKVSQLTRIHLWVRGQGLSHCKPILHSALSVEIDVLSRFPISGLIPWI